MTYKTKTWHIRLSEKHYDFFSELAIKNGDLEQGKESRQCRKFLDEKISEYKQRVRYDEEEEVVHNE